MTTVVGKPTIPEVAPLIAAYYAKPGNGVGGSLHIVLDDGNVEDHSLQSCRNRAWEQGDEDGAMLADVLLLMSKTQRRKLANGDWKRWTDGRNGHREKKLPRRYEISAYKSYPGPEGYAGLWIVATSGHEFIFVFDATRTIDLTNRESPPPLDVQEMEF